MRSDEPDAIDRVIDEALSRYASEEPLAGLEQRVLQRIREKDSRLTRWWWLAAVGFAASLGLMAVVWTRPVAEPVRVELTMPKPTPILTAAVPSRRPSSKRREFPTRVPFTREERALMALVEQAPEETARAFRELRQRSDEPIRVEEIKIQLLQAEDSR